MFSHNRWQSEYAALIALGTTVGTLAPLITPTPSFAQTTDIQFSAQTSFFDVQSNYWAAQFIQKLAQRGVIAGFPDGSFHPEEPVTRAQFAAMLNKAFQKAPQRSAITFTDVPNTYWASSAIQQAYTTGFLTGYPGNNFQPNQEILREQVLVSLANGLEYHPDSDTESTLQNFSDASNIDSYARSSIAAATHKHIVVNYPDVKLLNPKQTATRAQVAAFIYQALVSFGQASAINSPYIVPYIVAISQQTPPQRLAVTIPQGTVIPVKYDQAKKILLTKDETAPLTLTVAKNVVTDKGIVVIPAGSQVVGQLKPVKDKKGSQFVAQKLTLTTGQEYQISATSEPITKTERVNRSSGSGSVVKDAALGAGAAAAVSAVAGNHDVTVGKILGGAGLGGLFSLFFGKKSVDLIAIDPNTDLQMTISQNLQISLK